MSKPVQYRNKPVVIEAMHLDGTDFQGQGAGSMSTNITEDQLGKAAEAIKPLVLDRYTDLDAEDVAWDAARAAFEALGFTTRGRA